MGEIREIRRVDEHGLTRVLRFNVWYLHDGRVEIRERRLTPAEFLMILIERRNFLEFQKLIGSEKLPWYSLRVAKEWVVEANAPDPVREQCIYLE